MFAICEHAYAVYVTSRKKVLEAAAVHGSLSGPLDAWYRIDMNAEWPSIEEVRSRSLD